MSRWMRLGVGHVAVPARHLAVVLLDDGQRDAARVHVVEGALGAPVERLLVVEDDLDLVGQLRR